MIFGPVALSCLIFAGFGFIGYGIVNELGRGYDRTRIWLLAPFAGLSVTTILATALSRLGAQPARVFGWPLIASLLAAAALYFALRRPSIALRTFAVWSAAFAGALLLVGWPLVVAGFNWISYANGDMLNYVQGAIFFHRHSLYELPAIGEFLTERDVSWDSSMQYSLGEVRWASQLVLATIMAVSNVKATQAYMPFQLALHLIALATAAALLCSEQSRRRLALISVLVIAGSANFALGAYYQLLPQDFGIAALAASCTVLMNRPRAGAPICRQGILGGLFVATLLVAYPEMSPFLAIAVAAYIVLDFLRNRSALPAWLLMSALAIAFALLLANRNLIGAAQLLILSAHHGASPVLATLFPYYITPLAPGLTWGLIPYGSDGSTWLDQVYILIGFALTLVAIPVLARDAWRLQPAAIVTIVMSMLFAELFVGKGAFGLFKLAMYIQPFLLGSLTVSLVQFVVSRPKTTDYEHLKRTIFRPSRWAVIMSIIAVLVLTRNLELTYAYGAASLGRGIALVELPGWTQFGAMSQLNRLQQRRRGTIISDAFNSNVANFEAAYSSPNPTLFFGHFMGPWGSDTNSRWSGLLGNRTFRSKMLDYVEEHNKFYTVRAVMKGAVKGRAANFDEFWLDPRIGKAVRSGDALILESPNPTLFNRWGARAQANEVVRVRSYAEARDFISFVASERGEYGRFSHSIWRYEPDWYNRGRLIEAIGRNLLFNVANPRPHPRVEIEYTSSLQADNVNIIPPISVLGTRRIWLPVVGHGAARLFSAPISPQMVDGLSFLELDMGRDGAQFPTRRWGIMSLFGTKYNFDPRSVVGFIRDISVVSDEEYHAMRAPENVAHFPQDLQNPSLEFSGIYEDGWVADRARIWLRAAPGNERTLTISALLPQESAEGNPLVRVAVDGKTVVEERPAAGEFTIRVSAAGDGRRHRIELKVSSVFHLPNGDGRPASILLRFLGYS